MYKRLLSYFIPVNIYKKSSAISKNVEVSWNNGQLVLDSLNTNYSYGSLQRILRIGLQSIGFDTIRSMNHILVLGVAGGSVIKTLTDEIKFGQRITGVEIDPEIITVANQYFNLDKIPNLQIVIDDAFDFVLKSSDRYDLVIIDIFQDTTMPNFLFEQFFINHVGGLLSPNGYVMFNTMILKDVQEIRNRNFIAQFDPNRYSVRSIPRLEKHNELIVIQKRC